MNVSKEEEGASVNKPEFDTDAYYKKYIYGFKQPRGTI